MFSSIAQRILYRPEIRTSIAGAAARAFVRRTARVIPYPARFRMEMNAVERPHYAYCLLGAANLARSLGLDRISAIEFGVAGGNGLAFMVEFAEDVRKETGVTIECYGFDTGTGMPPPDGLEDLPYWFHANQYRMDIDALRRRVPEASLVLGDISETVRDFLDIYRPAPIAAIFNDTDYWSSTRDSLRLFDMAGTMPEHFLPRCFMYFDDIIGSEIEMYGDYNGQRLAIRNFNETSRDVRIHLNQNLMNKAYLPYRFQIYYAHIFNHPSYATYVGGEAQERIERNLRLKGETGAGPALPEPMAAE